MTMSLQFFPAPNPNKTGVLVAPGGGYFYISEEKEGSSPAKWLNERGFDAWVLSYTCADGDTTSPIYPAPQREALDAVKKIRAEDRVSKLGIWGWSAGGHLAAITATTPETELDFVILSYPVISMDYLITHSGSRTNLLGDDAPLELVQDMSAHNRVSEATPPTFIFHTANDGAVPVQNSLLFATAMAQHHRPFKLFVLPGGPHGIGLALADPELTWTAELDRWLKGFITA
jgi:acetyl esterase/lipase